MTPAQGKRYGLLAVTGKQVLAKRFRVEAGNRELGPRDP